MWRNETLGFQSFCAVGTITLGSQRQTKCFTYHPRFSLHQEKSKPTCTTWGQPPHAKPPLLVVPLKCRVLQRTGYHLAHGGTLPIPPGWLDCHEPSPAQSQQQFNTAFGRTESLMTSCTMWESIPGSERQCSTGSMNQGKIKKDEPFRIMHRLDVRHQQGLWHRQRAAIQIIQSPAILLMGWNAIWLCMP